MIWESSEWKIPLFHMAERLDTFRRTRNFNDEELTRAERDVLIGFFSIRKLIEARTKLSDRVSNSIVALRAYPCNRRVRHISRFEVERNYDLNKESSEAKSLRFVCNVMIHSTILVICITDDGLPGSWFFTSDKDKDKCIYCIANETVIELFRQVSLDDVNSAHWKCEPATGGEEFKNF